MAVTTIMINGEPFSYESEVITYDNNGVLDEKDAYPMLEATQRLLSERGVPVYLAFGTLLGAIREKGIIKGDEDIDVMTDNEDNLIQALPYLYENGLCLFRHVKGRVYSFFWKGTRSYIDIYIIRPMKRSAWSIYCYALDDKATPKKYFKEYQDIDFLGLKCRCPKDPEKIVEFWYGKDWRTPVRGHKFFYCVPSYHYWSIISYHTKNFIMTAIGWPYWRHLVLKRFKNQAESLAEWNNK